MLTAVAEVPDGLTFSHWESGGVPVSYDSRYRFIVSGDMTLTACYGPEASAPLIVLDSASSDPVNDRLFFLARADIGDANGTMVECGVLLWRGATPPPVWGLEMEGMIKGRAALLSSTGQFFIAKAGVPAGEAWTGRGYMVYWDSDGQLQTVFSEKTMTVTMPEGGENHAG